MGTPSPHRRTAATLAVVTAVVAVVALAVAVPVLARSAGRGATSVVTAPAAEGHRATTAASRAPDGLDLTSAWPRTNGDGSPVTTTDRPGVGPVELCGRTAWSPTRPVAARDVAGASYTGEAEDVRGRTLAVYADEADAAAALEAVRRGIAGCPRETVGGTVQLREVVASGPGSLVVTHRYAVPGGGADTGLEVLSVDRVGNTLLLAIGYGEGGATPASTAAAVERHRTETATVLRQLCPSSDC